jgi:hypothetical protein
MSRLPPSIVGPGIGARAPDIQGSRLSGLSPLSIRASIIGPGNLLIAEIPPEIALGRERGKKPVFFGTWAWGSVTEKQLFDDGLLLGHRGWRVERGLHCTAPHRSAPGPDPGWVEDSTPDTSARTANDRTKN